MKLLADLHISPTTVDFLRHLGHDVVRVSEVIDPRSSDATIVAHARADGRTILTQDLDFSQIIALSGEARPSLILLRLSSSRVEFVNSTLERVLPRLAVDVEGGFIAAVTDKRIRTRRLPLR